MKTSVSLATSVNEIPADGNRPAAAVKTPESNASTRLRASRMCRVRYEG